MDETYCIDWAQVPERPGISGIPIKLVAGEHMQMALFTLPVGFANTPHQHASEQMGYVLAGRIEYVIDGETIIREVGDSYRIPSNSTHAIRVLSDEPAQLLEVFSPLREDYR